MKTAKEILDKHVGIEILKPYPNVEDAMIEFAKMHVTAFRKEINNKTELWDDCEVIPRVSIDEIYLLTNIK